MGDLISIIVPAYNVEQYIGECIESILQQTYSNFELIIINDGSVDNTPIIINDYAVKDSRIKLVNQKNSGQGAARNKGIEASQGKYIVFIDSDDIIASTYLNDLYDTLLKSQSDIVICQFCSDIGLLNNSSEKIDIVSGKRDIMNNFYSNKCMLFVVPWNKIYKRELFENNRFSEDGILEDEGTLYKVFYESNKIAIIDKFLYFYRIREQSTMNSTLTDKNLIVFSRLENVVTFFENNNEIELSNKAKIRLLKNAAIYCFRSYKEEKCLFKLHKTGLSNKFSNLYLHYLSLYNYNRFKLIFSLYGFIKNYA